MLKSIALILTLMSLSVAPIAWGQDDLGNDDDEMQASDESADEIREEGVDEDVAPDESADMADFEDAGMEATDTEGEQEDFSDLASDGDLADESGDEAASADEDAAPEAADSADPAAPTANIPPAIVTPPVAPAPPSANVACQGAGTTLTGTVKWFDDGKGFGYISPDDGSADVYAHYLQIKSSGFKSLTEAQRVQFQITCSNKGRQAVDIKPA